MQAARAHVAGFLLETARAQVAELERLRPRNGGIDPEAVHDQRVATRRLRAALRLLGGRELEDVRRSARELQDALGGVRDLHVQLEWLDSPDADGRNAPASSRVADRQRRKLLRRERRLREVADTWARGASPRLRARLAELDSLDGVLDRRVVRRLLKATRSLGRALRALESGLDAERAHRARIRAKRLRYQLEIVEPLLGEPSAEALERLAALQGRLGDLHDVDVRLRLLVRNEARGSRRSIERLERRVARSRRACEKAALRELRRWREARLVRRMRKTLLRLCVAASRSGFQKDAAR